MHHLSLSGWIPRRDELGPLGPVEALVPPALFVVLLASRPSLWLNLTLLPALVASSLYSALAYTTGSAPDDYGRASLAFVVVLRAIDAFLVAKPSFQVAFTRRTDVQAPPPWTSRRLGYAFKLATTLRGAGWNWHVTPTPSDPTASSRTAFIRRALAKAAAMYLALDVTSTYMQSRPYFHRAVALSTLSTTEHFANMLAACASAALALNTVYQVVCIVSVASQAWDPDECVDLFGSVRHATSLAGFWGKTWHQSFRRPFTSISKALVTDLVRLSPSSSLSRLLSMSFAFFLSASLHAFSSFAMARTGLRSFKFFLVQPCGILVESVVASVFGHVRRGRGRARVARSFEVALGYAWTASWLLYWCPLFFDELVQAGFWEVDAAPFSVVRGIWKGEWLHV